jgi:hypothetical protein
MGGLRLTEVGTENVNYAATHSFRFRLAVMAIAVVGALAGILLVSAAGSSLTKAHAQSAACGQYNHHCGGCHATNSCPPPCPNPPCQGRKPHNGGGGNPPGGGAAGPSGGAGGSLPFTGYPLTPLILLLLLLLAGGLLIRSYLAVRDRVRGRHAAAGPLDLR